MQTPTPDEVSELTGGVMVLGEDGSLTAADPAVQTWLGLVTKHGLSSGT
jgi:hypothetical protein